MSKKQQVYDVVIVGAGMVGSALACGLAQQSLRVALVDKKLPAPIEPDESPRIRVSALHLASEQLLRNLGAWQHIAAQRTFAYQYLAVKEMPDKKSGFLPPLPDISNWATTRFEASELDRPYLGHIVENDVIQLGLIERVRELENIYLKTGDEVVSTYIDNDMRIVELASGERLQAQLVIGADGAQSQVRRLANIGQSSDAYEQHAMVVSVSYTGATQSGTWQAFRPQGPLAFLPLSSTADKKYASLVWYDSAETIKELKALSTQDLRRKIQASFPAELPPLNEILQVASFPLVKSHAHTYSAERVVLVGDAAHTINPLAGQGVNLGFMDAAALIEKLGKAHIEGHGLFQGDVVKAYEKARRLSNQVMMSAMDGFYYGFSSEATPLKVLRNIGLGLAQRSGPIKQKVLEYATGLQGDIPKLAQVQN